MTVDKVIAKIVRLSFFGPPCRCPFCTNSCILSSHFPWVFLACLCLPYIKRHCFISRSPFIRHTVSKQISLPFYHSL